MKLVKLSVVIAVPDANTRPVEFMKELILHSLERERGYPVVISADVKVEGMKTVAVDDVDPRDAAAREQWVWTATFEVEHMLNGG